MNFQNTLDNLKSNSNWQVLKTYLIEMKIKYHLNILYVRNYQTLIICLVCIKKVNRLPWKAMRLEPNDVLVVYNYAVALYSNEKFSEAIVQLK